MTKSEEAFKKNCQGDINKHNWKKYVFQYCNVSKEKLQLVYWKK